MLAVARQSYALTLYTLWHLQQWERVRLFEREAETIHAATLSAFAMHEPNKLDDFRREFSSQHKPKATIDVIRNRFARVADLVKQHAHMQPIVPSEPT